MPPGIPNYQRTHVKAVHGLETIADTNDEATKQQSLQIMLLSGPRSAEGQHIPLRS